MNLRRNYWYYSIGLAVAWAIVLSVVFAIRPDRAQTFLYIFAGYCLGWISTTIARYIYPPPKRWTSGGRI